MVPISQILGQRFHNLVVSGDAPKDPTLKSRMKRVLAKCDCGSEKAYFLANLRIGNTKSCGCAEFTPRVYDEPVPAKEYAAWRNMKQRCLNENSGYYPDYGGRGITVCDRWANSFQAFLEDMGRCPENFALGRRDVDGSYTPENTLWTDRKTLARNRRRSKA